MLVRVLEHLTFNIAHFVNYINNPMILLQKYKWRSKRDMGERKRGIMHWFRVRVADCSIRVRWSTRG
jgi:hypothetical protein